MLRYVGGFVLLHFRHVLFLCKGEGGSQYIAFFFIESLRRLYGGFFPKKCHVAWCTPGSVGQLFEAWRGSPLAGCSLTLWRIIPSAILWPLWKEKNERTFNGKESP